MVRKEGKGDLVITQGLREIQHAEIGRASARLPVFTGTKFPKGSGGLAQTGPQGKVGGKKSLKESSTSFVSFLNQTKKIA